MSKIINNGAVVRDFEEHSSDFVAVWEKTEAIDNNSGAVKVTLPEATEDKIGAKIEFWVEGDPSVHNVTFESFGASDYINGSIGIGNKIQGVSNSSLTTYFVIVVQCRGAGKYYISNINTVNVL